MSSVATCYGREHRKECLILEKHSPGRSWVHLHSRRFGARMWRLWEILQEQHFHTGKAMSICQGAGGWEETLSPGCGQSLGREGEQGCGGRFYRASWVLGMLGTRLLFHIRPILGFSFGNTNVKYNLLHLFTCWNSCGCYVYNLRIYRSFTETHSWLTILQIAIKNVNVINRTHLMSSDL